MKFLKLSFIYIQQARHFALRDVLILKNPDTSEKARQFVLRSFNTKILTLYSTQFFIKVLEIGRMGGGFLSTKNNGLSGTFLFAKKNALSVTFSYSKSLTLCVTFL